MKGMTLHEVKGFFMGVAKEENTIFAKAKSTKKNHRLSSKLEMVVSFFVRLSAIVFYSCGGKGIRTPGTFQYNSFQDCRNRPLCHPSNICFL